MTACADKLKNLVPNIFEDSQDNTKWLPHTHLPTPENWQG